MGTSCNVMNLWMRSQAHLLFKNGENMKLIFIYLLQPPIRKIYKLKNIIHQRWLRKEMKHIFSNYVTMFIHLLQPPIKKIYKLKNIIHQRWLRREMKRIFSKYVTMFRLLTEDFEDKRLIRTQTHTRRIKKLGWEGGLKIFSQTWNNWSQDLMRGKSF